MKLVLFVYNLGNVSHINDNQDKSMIFNINRYKVTMSCLSDLKYFVVSLHDSSKSKFF